MHKQEHKVDVVKRKPIQGVCMVLALVKGRGRLAPAKLGELSNPMGLEPMRYDA
jgi:hypothetical protein